jgi:hypothetical protein
MRETLKALAVVFVRAWGSATAWTLAGCGWGVVIGAALEATFGLGPGIVLEAAGQISLEAATGAVLGVAAQLLLIAFFGAELFALMALQNRLRSRLPRGNPVVGVRHERRALIGAFMGLPGLLSCLLGFGAFGGAGLMMELIHGGRTPWEFVEWGAAFGCLAGAVIGNVELLWTLHRALPPSWQEELRRGFQAPQPAPFWAQPGRRRTALDR